MIKNLNKLNRVPDKLKEQIFEKVFETAEIARFTPDQVRSYEDSLKYYRDLKNSLDSAKEEGVIEGIEKGIEKGKVEVAKNLIENNVSIEIIMKSTGLTKEQIEQLK